MKYSELNANDKTAPKELLQMFRRAGLPAVQSAVGKARRQNSMSFKPIFMTFADSQTLELRMKESGDFYQVLINGKIIPIKEQDSVVEAVAELVKKLQVNSRKFQAALARKKVKLPTGVKSTIKRKEEIYAERIAELDTAIAEARAQLA